MADDGAREELPGTSGDQQGGLLTVPKERHVFKAPAPQTSLLGLDRLAAQKRAEQGKQGSVLGKTLRAPMHSVSSNVSHKCPSPRRQAPHHQSG